MKKYWLVLSMAGLLYAPTLQATLQVTLTQNLSQYSFGVGGEFRASGTVIPGVNPTLAGYNTGSSANTASTGPSTAYFQTFCIEYNEHFSPGATYNVTISDRAMYGSQPPNGDPISIGTAWLYSQFAAGTLSGYNYAYGGGRTTTAGALQQAIWWLEGEAADPGVGDIFRNAAIAKFGSAAAAKADANGAYGVFAMNLWTTSGGFAQDQLIVVPEPATVIAGLLLLLPLGASTIRILRRKSTA